MADQPLRLRTTLAVLAGGRGSRMGMPKDRLLIGGKPVLAYLLDRFQWPGPTLLVTAPGANPMAASERFTAVVTDPVEGDGPLRGVITALDACTTEFLIVTTVDMPGWDGVKIDLLVDQLATRSSLGVMFRHDGQIEPFPLAISASARSELSQHFNNGGRSTIALSGLESFAFVDAPASWAKITWTNLNRRADVDEFENLVSR